jgi:hypothetical protein
MQQNEMHSGEAAVAGQEPGMNFGERLGGILMEPRAAFEDIDRRGGWLGIFLVLCACALGSMYVLTTRMDHETYMRKALEMSPFTKSLSEQQIQEVVSRPQSAFQRYSGFVLAPVGILVAYLVMAAALLVIFLIMGASINFKKSLAVTMWGAAPPGIIMTVLGIVLMYVKEPETLSIDPSKNVTSNLGLLVSDKAHPVLASLLGSVDVFSAWSIALLAIGFATISQRKLTTGQAATGVIIGWLVWVLGKAGFAALFS